MFVSVAVPGQGVSYILTRAPVAATSAPAEVKPAQEPSLSTGDLQRIIAAVQQQAPSAGLSQQSTSLAPTQTAPLQTQVGSMMSVRHTYRMGKSVLTPLMTSFNFLPNNDNLSSVPKSKQNFSVSVQLAYTSTHTMCILGDATKSRPTREFPGFH